MRLCFWHLALVNISRSVSNLSTWKGREEFVLINNRTYCVRSRPHVPVPQLTVTAWRDKCLSVHARKAYRESRGITPLILKLCIGWRWVVKFTPEEKNASSYWRIDLEPVWTIWRGEKSLAFAGNRIPESPRRNLITITLLSLVVDKHKNF
jgi:hypothetical protein